MPNKFSLGKISPSNPKLWIVIGVGVAGIVILTETQRRRARKLLQRQNFGAFIERFELLPFPQPPPPAAKQLLADLTFAVADNFDIKGYVTGFGNPDWKKTHETSGNTAMAITALLKNGATCVGKTIMGELGFGLTGENVHYGTPINLLMPSHIPGGSASGSAVAVASGLVDFALGTDTTGCVRIAASFCGVLGFRSSHGAVSTIGLLPNSQSLETVGWFACDPSILHHVGCTLLHLNQVEPRQTRRLIVADDFFQLSNIPSQKTVQVVSRVAEKLSGYQTPKHVNLGQHILSNVPSLKIFLEESANVKIGISTLKALSSVMLLLQGYEFRTNHEEWVKSTKPKFGPDVSGRIHAALATTHENIKALYKVKTELQAALQSLLKDDGILVMPTVIDPPLKLRSKKGLLAEFHERVSTLLSIASMSGCCQVTIPLSKQNDYPLSVSLMAFNKADKFLLDTMLDMYSSLQEQSDIIIDSPPSSDMNGNMDASELLKEKGNAAYKGRQWIEAANYYGEAIKLNAINATYYSNRAAAYLQLRCFREAEADCNQAISLDKKNVKAYLRRGTSREKLLSYKEALQDFKHALVLEPQNKVASEAEKRLRKLTS